MFAKPDAESGSKLDFYIFLFLFGATAFYFLLETFTDATMFAETIAFVVVGSLFVGILAHEKADDDYYFNLNPLSLAICLLTSLLMVGIASIFTVYLAGYQALSLFSMLTILPPRLQTSMSTFSTINALPTSVFTCFVSDTLYTIFIVATVEELFKLTGYTVLKSRDRIVLAFIVPVGLWAAYHGIQAYNNPVMIIPAFFNGLLLIGLLEAFHSFLAPIIAHGTYNAITIVVSYIKGEAGVNASFPFFPAVWGTGDFFPVILSVAWLTFLFYPILKRDPDRM